MSPPVPPPPSDPTTPNEQGPGTPNSTTTSLSALSVVAIKDGAAGHNHHTTHHGPTRHPPSGATLDAERADRISRLAGLERVSTVRPSQNENLMSGAGGSQGHYGQAPYAKEISTVGTASATGSVGGKTTWASESMSMDYENADKMSEDQEHDEGDGVSSTGGFSDDNDKASLVGFGEGAGSTVSGPVSTANARMIAARNSLNNPYAHAQSTPRSQPLSMQAQHFQSLSRPDSGGNTPMSGVERSGAAAAAGSTEPKMMDGITFDQGVIDTTVSTPPPATERLQGSRFSGVGAEVAEHVMRDRIDDRDPRAMTTPPNQQSLGRFGFERD